MSMILDGSNGVTFNDSSLQGAAASPYVLKNRIINGAMVIDQRNAGASGTTNAYTIDRWTFNASLTTKGTWQQNAGSVTPPAGFTNYWGFTSNSAYSVGSGENFNLLQKVEGYNVADLAWGTANAQTVTLSFWVRSSLTGTFGGAFTNSANNRSYPFSYTISAANTWEYKTITVAGDTSGTWLTTNGTGIQLWFGLGVGSTLVGTAGSWSGNFYVSATGATSVVGTNGATWYITGVQLEIGTSATPFERRLYNQELANCQRYYQQYDASESAAAGGGLSGVCGSTSIAVVTGILPVEMRATPSFNFNNLVINYGGATTVVTTTAGFYSGKKAVGMDITGTGTPLTLGRAAVIQFTGGQSAANRWFLSAEL